MMALPADIPDYFPPANARYEVRPGFVRFGKDVGGGRADAHVFQINAPFPRYRANKLAARRERLSKYFCTHDLTAEVERAIAQFIVGQLLAEHPRFFRIRGSGIDCGLTDDRLDAGYAGSALDALAMQMQEDFAVVSTNGDKHWISAIHLCAPNHWAAEDKIGRTFDVVHRPVAGMERMNEQADQLVQVMLYATDGLVRFAWGVTWDDDLNHHPDPPPGDKRKASFDPADPRAFLRVERQTVWGFPTVGAALFTIRTYLYDLAVVRRDSVRASALADALRSMSDASAAYKGLTRSREPLITWLTSGGKS